MKACLTINLTKIVVGGYDSTILRRTAATVECGHIQSDSVQDGGGSGVGVLNTSGVPRRRSSHQSRMVNGTAQTPADRRVWSEELERKRSQEPLNLAVTINLLEQLLLSL